MRQTLSGPSRMLVCLGFLAAVSPLSGQEPAATNEKWGAISNDELGLKDNPAMPNSPAMILYRETYTDDVGSFQTDYFRIKIFTDAGKKYADVKIPYIGNEYEIQDIRARTVRPDGTSADFQGQVLDTTVLKARKLNFQAKSFLLPDVQTGSIIEYSYRTHWRAKAPDVLKHPQNYVITAFVSFPTARWVLQDELFIRRARFTLRPLPHGRIEWASVNLPKGADPQEQPDGTLRLDAENVPAFQQEEYMPPEDAVKPRVDFFYVIGGGSPSGFWTEQGRLASERFDKFVGKSKDMAPAVATIVGPNDTPETKLRKIYDRVEQIRYLGYEHQRTEKEEKRQSLKENKSAEDILKRGYAVGNDVNLFFVALARAAGFNASPVLVVTRDRDFFHQNVLDARQLDGIVVWVQVGSQDRYFDPATRYCPFDLLPWAESGVTGVRVRPESIDLITTPNPKSAEAVIERKATLQVDRDGNLQGKLQVNFVGQEALQRRLYLREEDELGRRKKLEDEVKPWLPAGATVELVNVPTWDRAEEPLRAEFTLTVPQFATPARRRLLLPASILQATRKLPFQHAERTYAIYLDYPYEELDDITLQMPTGYHSESVPAPLTNNTTFGSYEARYESQGGALHLSRHLVVAGFIFRPQYYGAVKLFFAGASARDEEQIILRTNEAGAQQ